MPQLNETDRPIVRPSGLAEEVYRRIRADIMSLRIPPDTRVSGLAIAAVALMGLGMVRRLASP